MEREEIDELLGTQLQEVLALDTPPSADARLSEDLRADSLDLIEVIESVERRLDDHGLSVRIDDDVLRGVVTVADAGAALAQAVAAVRTS